jgi:hypothetical protein
MEASEPLAAMLATGAWLALRGRRRGLWALAAVPAVEFIAFYVVIGLADPLEAVFERAQGLAEWSAAVALAVAGAAWIAALAHRAKARLGRAGAARGGRPSRGVRPRPGDVAPLNP